jgi:hypothetical protein
MLTICSSTASGEHLSNHVEEAADPEPTGGGGGAIREGAMEAQRVDGHPPTSRRTSSRRLC